MVAGRKSDNYSVLGEHPERGALDESFSTISAAVARAVEFIRNGYSIEIVSASSLIA
jgi:hypothetical protein